MRFPSEDRSMMALLRLGACVAALAPVRAGAAEDPEALIRQGNELRRAGQDEQAVPLFRRAHELSPSGRTAGQLGLAEFAVRRFVEADAHLVESLRSRDDPWVARHRATLEQVLAAIRSQVSHIEVTGSPPSADVLVNGRLIGRLPRTPTVAVNPGRVEISVSLTGHESMREVRELTPGAHEKVDVRLQALVAGPLAIQDRAAPPPTSSWMRPTGVVVGAAGLLGVGSGVVLWFVADGKRDKIDSDAAAGRPYDPANGNWRTLGRASTVCLVAGGAAILAGGALWLLGRRDETTVAVAPTSDGVALQLGGIF